MTMTASPELSRLRGLYSPKEALRIFRSRRRDRLRLTALMAGGMGLLRAQQIMEKERRASYPSASRGEVRRVCRQFA